MAYLFIKKDEMTCSRIAFPIYALCVASGHFLLRDGSARESDMLFNMRS
jgi:hypothetical protein